MIAEESISLLQWLTISFCYGNKTRVALYFLFLHMCDSCDIEKNIRLHSYFSPLLSHAYSLDRSYPIISRKGSRISSCPLEKTYKVDLIILVASGINMKPCRKSIPINQPSRLTVQDVIAEACLLEVILLIINVISALKYYVIVDGNSAHS